MRITTISAVAIRLLLGLIAIFPWAALSSSVIYAQSNPIVRITNADLQGAPGTVEVWLEDFDGLTSAELWLFFDDSLAKVVSIQTDEAIPGMYVLSNPFSNEIRCIWIAGTEPPFSGTALWFTITFEPISSSGFSHFTHNAAESSFNPGMEPEFSFGYLSTAPGESSPPNAEQEQSSHSPAPQGEELNDPGPGAEIGHANGDAIVASMHLAPSGVRPDEAVTVTATMCNPGSAAISEAVALEVNGELDQKKTVAITGGACQEIVFTVSRAVPGTYLVAIDGMTEQFTVLPSVPAPPPPGSEVVPPPAPNGISTPVILAIVGVMLLLISVLVFFFRRA